jgi:ABC-type amino acid transport substrate-binding protein
MTKTVLVLLLFLFGAMDEARARTLDDVRSSGVVTCGLDSAKPGFSQRDANYNWSGMFVDLCRAIAASIFADSSRTNLVNLAPEERVVALQSGEIDVLMQTEAMRSGKDSADGLMWVVPFFHAKDSRFASYAPMVRQGDDQWFQVVREVEYQLIRAAEQGITQAEARALLEQSLEPEQELLSLGFAGNWRAEIIAGAGNHAEILVRNFGVGADSGVNAGWSKGGLHWAPP